MVAAHRRIAELGAELAPTKRATRLLKQVVSQAMGNQRPSHKWVRRYPSQTTAASLPCPRGLPGSLPVAST